MPHPVRAQEPLHRHTDRDGVKRYYTASGELVFVEGHTLEAQLDWEFEALANWKAPEAKRVRDKWLKKLGKTR